MRSHNAGKSWGSRRGGKGNKGTDDDPQKDGDQQAVTFSPSLGADVVVNDLVTYASNVKYSGFTVNLSGGGQPDVRAGSNVVLERLHATNFYVQGPTNNVVVRGGEYGPFASCGGGAH